MSETDSFIQEVTEEVRHDRMFRLWKKYGPYGIAALVAIVAASAGWTWMKHREVEAARELGGAFLATDIASVEQQEKLVAEVQGPAATVAQLRLAAAKAEAGDREGAAALYREIGATPGLDPAYGDLARLQAVRVAAATMDPAQAIAALDELTVEGRPYRLLALELRAAIKLNAGDTAGAQEDLRTIINDTGATRDLADRASAMLFSSGGDLATVTQ